MYLSGLDITDLYTRRFYHLVNALSSQTDIRTREKSQLYLAYFLFLLPLGVFESNTYPPWLNKWVIYKKVNHLNYI